MKRFLTILTFCGFIASMGMAWADTTVVGGGSGVSTASDCSTYIAIGQLCQDTDDGKLYKGTGAAVEEITGAPAVADTTDTSTWVLLTNDITATTLAPKTDAGLSYNAGTGVLTATGFSGPLTGNVTGTVSGNAGTVTIIDSTDTTTWVLLSDDQTSATGAVKTDGGLAYNASTGILTATGFAGPLNGTIGATTPAAGSFTTVTVAASASPTMLLNDSDALGADKEIAKIVGAYIDGADGSENGTLDLYAHVAGTTTSLMQLDGKNNSVEVNAAQFKLPSSNADNTATAGYMRHDSTVTNHADGALRWHDGTNIRQVVDMVAATAEGCTGGYVVAYNSTTDLFYCKEDATGGTATIDSLGDAAADGTIAMTGYELTLTSTLDEANHSVLTIYNNDADRAADTTLLTLKDDDAADANAFFIKMIADADGTPATIFSITGLAATITPATTITGQLTMTANPRIYDGDSHHATFDIGDLSGDTTITFPASTSTLAILGANTFSAAQDFGDNDLTSVDKIEGVDSGVYIDLGADGVVEIASDTEIKLVLGDEDLKLTKTGSNGITLGTNTGVTDVSTALNLVSTGTIAGRIPVVSDNNGLNIATTQIGGHFHLATGTGTWLLPAMAAADGTGYSLCVYSTTNDDVIFDVDASDKFRYNGALKTAGKSLTISDVGSFMCAVLSDYDSDIAHWTILGTKGTITAEAD